MGAHIPDGSAARFTGDKSSAQGRKESLKLVPPPTNKVTTTVTSSKKSSGRTKIRSDWQRFIAMGSTQDEHTSTSSLCEPDHEGVLMQQEVTVTEEERGSSETTADT